MPMVESETFDQVVAAADLSLLSQMGLAGSRTSAEGKKLKLHAKLLADDFTASQSSQAVPTPICNRCHKLTHHHSGTSVIHPTIRSLQEIISESPHKYNHIYHVLDAADFPLSLIPSIQRYLALAPQRSLNRRAKTSHFQYGRKAEMSFIITRSDLLAPKKEQVDSLMPYIVQVLRDALGGSGENVRLGNVRCVSSKRGWWTKEVKEEIWNRGGGGWMLGKVNVGKSALFENVFPKGRNEDISTGSVRHAAQRGLPEDAAAKANISPTTARYDANGEGLSQELPENGNEQLLGDSLLPPVPPETPYPVLPLVSSLPGTTASPIRIPFGGGKGELIDLPGLDRGDLEAFVRDEHRVDLVMRHRVKPEQFTIKPGQSLLIGGLVRVTPLTDVPVLAYPFIPLKVHVTTTERAIAIHTQKEDSGIPTITKSAIGSRMDPAGTFPLRWDVTKQRAGPLTRSAAAGISPKMLPFVVLSTDVLIEGCGWVELVAQIRKKDMEAGVVSGDLFDARRYPRVEVASPDGRHIGVRQPMGAWMLCSMKPRSSRTTVRPRRSMKGVKKNLKKTGRAEL